MTKVQLTLTDQEVDLLSAQAAQLGYNLTKFVKFIISSTAFNQTVRTPEFAMSQKAATISQDALEEHKQGNSIKVTSFAELAKL